jgi:hypothetical protein
VGELKLQPQQQQEAGPSSTATAAAASWSEGLQLVNLLVKAAVAQVNPGIIQTRTSSLIPGLEPEGDERMIQGAKRAGFEVRA